MKIAMVLEKWGFEGGREHHNVSMLRAFLERGHNCVLVYGVETDKQVRGDDLERVPKFCVPTLPFFHGSRDAECLSELLRYLNIESPDIVYLGHVRNIRTLKQIQSRWPVIVTLQDLWLVCLRVCKTHFFQRKPCLRRLGPGCLVNGCFLGKPQQTDYLFRFNNIYQLVLAQRIYKQFSSIVVASHFVKKMLIKNGFEEQRICVLGYFDEDFPGSTTPVPENGNVLFIGRIDRYKGIDILINALSKCRTSPCLTIVGDGPYTPKLKKLTTKLGLQNRVRFLGWIPHKALSNQMEKATLIAVPSIWSEPFCKVGIEAMGHGRPVVAFDVGGISDWLLHGKTGYLVPWKNSSVMASMIDKIYEDIDGATSMGHAARKIMETKFRKDQYLDRWEQISRRTISDYAKQNLQELQ